MPTSEQQRKNYEYFQRILPELLSDPLKVDKYAIIHEESVIGLYDTFAAAYRMACSRITKDFIIQQIIDESKNCQLTDDCLIGVKKIEKLRVTNVDILVKHPRIKKQEWMRRWVISRQEFIEVCIICRGVFLF